MATYYIATTGSNSNPGTEAQPWLLPQYAANQLRAGDTLTYRGGTYLNNVSYGYTYDGTAGAHVTVKAYPGETVVFDGQDDADWHDSGNGFIQVYGDYYDVFDMEVKNSGEAGFVIHGNHSTATRITSHDNWAAGIFGTGEYIVIDDCDAYLNSQKNENGILPISWSFGISLCRYPKYGLIKNCRSWNNWGEGISTFEGYNNTIQDCVIYDNFTVGLYVSDSQNALAQRNLSYYTAGNMTQAYCSSQNCILLGDEVYVPRSMNNRIINNLCMGGDRCLAAGTPQLGTTLVAHNTFVNAFDRIGSEAATIYFLGGSSTGGRFINNIILQEDTNVAIGKCEGSGVSFDFNNWSSAAPANMTGANDVVGDPKLAKAGSTAAGELTYIYFETQASAPGKDKATDVGVDTDYLGRSRA